MSWWSDLIGALDLQNLTGMNAAQNPTVVPGGTLTGVGQDLGAVPKEIAGIWSNLRDYKMWRSLGWLLLGIVLMLLGALWWIGPSASRASPAGTIARGLT